MSKRTNSIVAVTIAKYATVYVEADSPEEAMNLVKENKDEIYDGELMSELDDQFDDSCIEVDSCEAYTTEVEDWMEYIWADGEAISYDEYMEELEEQEE